MQRGNLQWQRPPTLVLVWRVQPQMQGLSWQVSRPQRTRLQWSKLGTSLFVPYRTWRQKSTMENWRVWNNFQLVWLEIGHIWGVQFGRNECWMLPKTWRPQSTMVNSIKIFHDTKYWNKPDAHCCWWWWTQVKLHIILVQPKLGNHRFVFRQQFSCSKFLLKLIFLYCFRRSDLSRNWTFNTLSLTKICKNIFLKVHLSISEAMVSFLARYNQPVLVQPAMITNFGIGLMVTTSNARLILTRFWTSMDKITMIEIGDKSPSTILNMEAKINNGQLMVAKSNPTGATWDWTYLRGVLRLEQMWDATKKMMLPTNSGAWSIGQSLGKDVAQWVS